MLENEFINLPSKEVYSNYLNFLLVLLNNQRLNESKRLKTIHQEELNAGFDEESDEEFEEEEEFYDDDQLLKKCVNKILKDKKFLVTNDLNTNQLGLEVIIFHSLNSFLKNFFMNLIFNRLISMSTTAE